MNHDRRVFCYAIGVGLATTGCDGIDVAEWTEEVKLHDGSVITIWRRARARSSGFPNAERGGDIDFELKYQPLGVQWKGTWHRDPVSFEIMDGIPHLVLYINDRESCSLKAKTDYTAQFLRWINGQWVDVSQSEFPIGRATMNLSGAYWGRTTKEDFKGLIRWDDKTLRGNKTDTVKSYFERGQRYCSRHDN
jgi:hypothetical protein